ncbi:hypothetical protein BURPS1710A_0150 [Burkholderia pseudomallei 1710a]|uniref:Uncharacterized protein n=2 Tax=pseudomallei group TaxID=111527 RepID=A2S6R0_BURM9|nr:hypothetical protein BMA10229_A1649 [Burkholderia mallei NCTC 10229]EET07084.1 hypothetical protein BURPS1710A_0150 [Burkholderia pseudomallei 1710a]
MHARQQKSAECRATATARALRDASMRFDSVHFSMSTVSARPARVRNARIRLLYVSNPARAAMAGSIDFEIRRR